MSVNNANSSGFSEVKVLVLKLLKNIYIKNLDSMNTVDLILINFTATQVVI